MGLGNLCIKADESSSQNSSNYLRQFNNNQGCSDEEIKYVLLGNKCSQLINLLQKQQYSESSSSPGQQPKCQIEQSIREIQSQYTSNLDKFKLKRPEDYILCSYQITKFYHFRSEYSRALKFLEPLLSFQRQNLLEAGISKLNLHIFKYLLEISHLIRVQDFQDDHLKLCRFNYAFLLRQIKKQQGLAQAESWQMIILVSCLFYYYLVANVQSRPQPQTKSPMRTSGNSTHNSETVKNQILDRIKADRQHLEQVVLRFGLQLSIDNKDGAVKKVQLIKLGNTQPLAMQQNGYSHCVKTNKSCNQLFFEVQVAKKFVNIPKKGTELIKIQQPPTVNNNYWIQSRLLESTCPPQQKSDLAQFLFLNLPAIYISKTNSACNPKLHSRWIKLYQRRKFCPVKTNDWDILAAHGLSITIKRQAKLPEKYGLNLQKQIQGLLKIYSNSALLAENKQASRYIEGEINPGKKIKVEKKEQLKSVDKTPLLPFPKQVIDGIKQSALKNQSQNQFDIGQQQQSLAQSSLAIFSQNEPTYRAITAKIVVQQQYQDRGLRNLGNTCYMNSALQCLHKSRPFVQCFSKVSQTIQNRFKKQGTYQLSDLFSKFIRAMWQSNRAFDPSDIKRVMGEKNYLFKHYNQNDATQFLITFLKIISQELNDPVQSQKKQINQYLSKSEDIYKTIKFNDDTRFRSIIEGTFTGRYKLKFYSTHSSCEHSYTLFQRFNVHYLQMPRTQNNWFKLEQCLQQFSKPDEFEADNCMTCETCNKPTFNRKTTRIYQTNKILMLNFKRFLNGSKDKRQIQVPEYLDPEKLIYGQESSRLQGKKYKLYGAIIHHGGLNGGHYYAICYNTNTNKWMQYNDSSVRPISQKFQQIDFSQAMTLFYELIDVSSHQIQENRQEDLIQKPFDQDALLKTKNQDEKISSMIYSVMQWLVRSRPFKDYFDKRIELLRKYKICLSKDLDEFEKVLWSKSIAQSYINKVLLKRKQIFIPGTYVANVSQLRNFITSFLQVLSQSFYDSFTKGTINTTIYHYERVELQKEFKKDLAIDLVGAILNVNYKFGCGHTTKQQISKLFSTIRFTGKQSYDIQSVGRFFDQYKMKRTSSKQIGCQECLKLRQYQYQCQLLPNQLFIIQLQRFVKNQKNSNVVSIRSSFSPEQICNCFKYQMYRDKIYRLSAVISHKGSVQEGYYYTHCYNFEIDKWIYCVGQDANALDVVQPKFEHAYCLIYQLVKKRAK